MKLLIAKDKLLHFIICAVIAILTGLVSHYLLQHPVSSSLFSGFFAAIFIGVCKEMYDVFIEGHSWEIGDLLADVAGAIIGGITGYLIMIL